MSAAAYPVHVEVQAKWTNGGDVEVQSSELELLTRRFLQETCAFFTNGELETTGHVLDEYVAAVRVVDLPEKSMISFWRAVVYVHIYTLIREPSEKDYLENEEGGLGQAAYEEWKLPNEAFDGLWDAIVVDDSIKQKLLGYCTTSTQFSEMGVDDKIISWNRMALLNGPPGTGKTTLCKALAQKIAIRTTKRFNEVLLLEINAHALFSKWFSESGKLVMGLFEQIDSLVADDPLKMVIVLIDEVESIASSRTASMTTSEPGDAVRVVNSVLTCLDNLRRRANALVLCTSNIVGSLDAAFRDRIDICLFLGNPSLQARYHILWTCMQELMSKGIVQGGQDGVNLPAMLSDEMASFVRPSAVALNPATSSQPTLPTQLLERTAATASRDNEMKNETESESSDDGHRLDENDDGELMLAKVAAKCEGLSGRRLRKLPLLALAFQLGRPPAIAVKDMLRALDRAILDVLQADLEMDSLVTKM